MARAHLEEALCLPKSNKSNGWNANNYRVRRLGKSSFFSSADFFLDFERVQQKGGDSVLRERNVLNKRIGISDLMGSKTVETKVSRWIFLSIEFSSRLG